MRVYLAATEDIYRERAQVKIHRLLLSYYGTEARLHAALALTKPDDWCVDSGAHFFLADYFKHGKRTTPGECEQHLGAFLDFLEGLEAKPSFAVELDLQELYGTDVVDDWRTRLLKPFEKQSGIPILYVWHTNDGAAGWHALLDDPDIHWLGLSNLRTVEPKTLGRMVMMAYEAGKPVHGFAAVRGRVLKQVPFYSVDSTSWGSVSLFGIVRDFNESNGTMRTGWAGRGVFKRDRKAAAAALLRVSRGGQVRLTDTLGVKAGGSLTRVYQYQADAYVQFEEWYGAYWRSRGIDWDKRLAAGSNQGRGVGGPALGAGADSEPAPAQAELSEDDGGAEGNP